MQCSTMSNVKSMVQNVFATKKKRKSFRNGVLNWLKTVSFSKYIETSDLVFQ